MNHLLDFRYAAPTDIPEARTRVQAALAAEGVPPTVAADAVLLLSELMSNALRHTTTPRPRVRVDVDGADLRIAVTDAGPTPPRAPVRDPQRVGGNGIRIIAALATDWGTHVHDGLGKTVWFCLPLTRT